MTPLAAYLAKQTVSHPKRREHIWAEEHNIKRLREELDDIHCFEITQCFPLFRDLARLSADNKRALIAAYSFLPAPKTWLEWRHGSGNRLGVLLEELHPLTRSNFEGWDTGTSPPARVQLFWEQAAVHVGFISSDSNDIYDGTPKSGVVERFYPSWFASGQINPFPLVLSYCHVALLLINSPKVIGRAQHLPNAGLERRLTQGFGVGKFPLHAWTELKLHVNKPVEIDDGEPHEAHLTGRRALHFVRKHIRIRRGQLEYVSAHWRGDAAIGIKQTRYEVVP